MEKTDTKGKERLPLAAEGLVPHRPPMLFVDQLVERVGDEARSVATLPPSGLSVCHGEILPEYYIELIAQTCAMANGYDCLIANKRARGGMLVGVDSFILHTMGQPGETVTVETSKTFEFGPITVIKGEIYSGKLLLAEGVIKVWEDLGGEGAG